MSNSIRKSWWLRCAAPAIVALTTTPIAAERVSASAPRPADSDVPAWAAEACWYQVMVARFRNGDPANDQPHTFPWTDNWLTQPPDDPPTRVDLYFRRYGGDLQGLAQKFAYLRELGVNSLYLNPVFAATSEHRYDTVDLRHVHDSYAVAGAMDRVVGETADQSTWQWSNSDLAFLDFIDGAHRAGLRVIIDGVFNHVGREFWAFRDLLERGRESPYAGWFDVTDFGPPLRWAGWDRPNGDLVRFARTSDGLAPAVEAHLWAITRRWMDPNGDGDPSDGVDGWRLDAAEQVPHGFWKRWRRLVKSINPEALIVGEIWSDPSAWLGGDEFDVVTDYRFAQAVVRFCRPGDQRNAATRLANDLEVLAREFAQQRTLAMVHLLGSHDTDRVVSMLANPGRPYDRDNLPGQGHPPYHAGRPDEEAIARLRLASALQFLLPGAPMLYYGDEVGMYGAEDPYCRAPMWWIEPGTVPPAGYRGDLRDWYCRLARLRTELLPIRRGTYRLMLADDSRRIIAFSRTFGWQRVAVLVNGSRSLQRVQLTLGSAGQAVALEDLSPGGSGARSVTKLGSGGEIELECPPLSAHMLLLDMRR